MNSVESFPQSLERLTAVLEREKSKKKKKKKRLGLFKCQFILPGTANAYWTLRRGAVKERVVVHCSVRNRFTFF